MNKFLLSTLSLFIPATFLFSQTGTIIGKVVDSEDFSLAGANAFIEELNIGDATDEYGQFIIANVPAGQHLVKVDYIGYQNVSANVDVKAGQVSTMSFILQSGVIEGENIIVLGERLKGQAKALNQQKTNPNITNIVSADQVGRFPDANIGDALKRIPAISVNYDQGEARFVNIRGTEPRLNSIMVNGERVPSAEAEIRSVQVDLIPSETIQTIEVNKAVTPDMDADAIGGSVNLITRGAPNELRVSGTVGSGYNFLSEEPLLLGSLVVADRFFDRKLGAVFSASYYDHNLGSDNTEGSWDNFNGVISPDEWEVRAYDIRRLRQSFSGELDYRLIPGHTLYLKGIYNHRNDWENRFRYRIRKIKAPENGMVPVGELVRQTKGGPNNDTNDGARLEDQRTTSINLRGDHIFADNIKVDWSAGYAKASEERPNERYIAWNLKAPEDAVTEEVIPFMFNADLSDLEAPLFTPSDKSQVSLDQWGLDELTEENQYTEEIDKTFRLDIEMPLIKKGVYKNSIKLGGKIKNKDKKRDNDFFEYEPVSGLENILLLDNKDYSDKDFLAGDYLVGRFTTPKALGSLDLNNPSLFEKTDAPGEYAAANFSATEKVTAGYLQLDQYISDKWQIIAGVRMEQTNIDYKGNEYIEEDTSGNENIISPLSGSDDYLDVLPGLHLTCFLNNKTNLRFAWTNTIARPNYYDLVPYRSIAGVTEEIAVGNPALNPTKSMNFDFMAEHYYENVGILSAGIFYKDIQDYIYIYSEKHFFDEKTGVTYDDYFQPRNGATANLFGLEFAFQRSLSFLPGFLKNLSIYANYTYTYSKADNPVLNEQVDNKNDIELPGTAPHTLNTNLTYDDSKIVLGLSFNYTSAYLDPDELDLTPGLERYYDEVTYLDLTGSYMITPQLRFFFEANNLLNQPLRYYAGDSKRTQQAEYYNVRLTTGIKFDL